METPDTAKKRILIIEDDQMLKRLVGERLGREGFFILEAATGEDGLEKMRTEHPDLTLLDIIMPDIDGFELLRRAGEDPVARAMPVIILSNYGGRLDDREKGFQLGAIDYIMKAETNLDEIARRVHRFFAESGREPPAPAA